MTEEQKDKLIARMRETDALQRAEIERLKQVIDDEESHRLMWSIVGTGFGFLLMIACGIIIKLLNR